MMIATNAPPANDVSPADPTVQECSAGRVFYWNVKDKDRKGHVGRVAQGQHAEIRVRSSIRLFGVYSGATFNRVFGIGDEVAYSGYNLTYTGQITAIGAKTVTVRDERVTKRLSIFDFMFWNRRFDAAEVRARNLETMQCI